MPVSDWFPSFIKIMNPVCVARISTIDGGKDEPVEKKPYAEMSKDEKIEELEAALIDVLDSHPDLYAVQAVTGGSIERAEELSDLYYEVEKEYTIRHKIGG